MIADILEISSILVQLPTTDKIPSIESVNY